MISVERKTPPSPEKGVFTSVEYFNGATHVVEDYLLRDGVITRSARYDEDDGYYDVADVPVLDSREKAIEQLKKVQKEALKYANQLHELIVELYDNKYVDDTNYEGMESFEDSFGPDFDDDEEEIDG